MNKRTVLITGCSSGLGPALTRSLRNRECIVIPHYRHQLGDGKFLVTSGDLTDPVARDEILSSVRTHSVNVFVNNAAVMHSEPLHLQSHEDIEDMLETNVVAQMLLLRDIYEEFRVRGNCIIVNISSIACTDIRYNEAVYAASKAAVSTFIKAIQRDASMSGVFAMNVYLGAMATRMASSRPDFHRLLKPDAVANTIADIITSPGIKYRPCELTIRRQADDHDDS